MVFAHSALASIDALITGDSQRQERALTEWGEYGEPDSLGDVFRRLREELDGYTWERDRLMRGGLAHRPPRKMPSLLKIAAYHQLPDQPACFRCEEETDAATWRTANSELQRAHIIDRVFDGLDSVANLLPLCPPCHRGQPIFKAGDEAKALAWFHTHTTDPWRIP